MLTFVGKVLILLYMKKSTPKTDVGGTSNRESMTTLTLSTPVAPLTLANCTGCTLRGADTVLSPQRAKELGYWGLIYRITLQLPGRLGLPMVYTGSKGFGPNTKTKAGNFTAAARAWEHYTSSSDDVNAKLATGLYRTTWEILGYGRTRGQCLAIEAKLINQSIDEYSISRVLNRAQVGGGKLTSNQNKYSKRKVKPQSNIRYS